MAWSILAVGALVGGWLLPRAARPKVSSSAMALPNLRTLGALWHHPYWRLATLGTVLALLSWAGLVARFGLSEVSTLAQSGVLVTPEQTQVCHSRQRRLADVLMSERGSRAPMPTQAELRLIPIRCPSGGEFSFDEHGAILCSVHGMEENASRVVIEKKRE